MAQEQVQLSHLSKEERAVRDAADIDVDHVYNATFEQHWLKRLFRRPKRRRMIPLGFDALRTVELLRRATKEE